MELQGVLNGDEPIEQVAEGVAEQVTEQPAVEQEAAPETEQSTSPPPGEKDTKSVPLSALEAVRHERTDWKEKAIRYEAELKTIKEMQTQQQPQEQVEVDPYVSMQNEIFNERLNMSEMLARKDHPDIDEKLAVFEIALKNNPALGAELRRQTHPWDWMYQQAKKIQMMQEMGDDPDSYRKKLEEELRAQIKAEFEAQSNPIPSAAPQAQIPQSLAGTRSAGVRNAPVWTGPSSLDSILK